jgi:excisionase family DNA binding protein
MKERMTLTDIARHLGHSRPTTYKIVRSKGFPTIGSDRKWDRTDVVEWLERNAATGAVVVGGVLVR